MWNYKSLLFIVLTLELSSSVQGAPKGCPGNLDKGRIDIFGSKCYQFVMEEMYWDEAASYCRGKKGFLVSVKTREIQQYIRSKWISLNARKNGYWLGGNDRGREGRFYWHDGSPLQQTYTNWVQGEPDNGCNFWCPDHDCVVLRSDSDWKWMDYPCHYSLYHYYFTCEYEITLPLTSTDSYTSTGISTNGSANREISHNFMRITSTHAQTIQREANVSCATQTMSDDAGLDLPHRQLPASFPYALVFGFLGAALVITVFISVIAARKWRKLAACRSCPQTINQPDSNVLRPITLLENTLYSRGDDQPDSILGSVTLSESNLCSAGDNPSGSNQPRPVTLLENTLYSRGDDQPDSILGSVTLSESNLCSTGDHPSESNLLRPVTLLLNPLYTTASEPL